MNTFFEPQSIDMKVALIYPPHPYLIRPYSQAPLGLAYLGAVLRKNGITVDIFNLSGEPTNTALDKLPTDYDLYGFTATSVDYKVCEHLAGLIKKRNPQARVVLGGAHATVAPEMVSPLHFDSYVIGEGEIAVLKMVQDIHNGSIKPFYKEDRLTDLDTLPYPARDLFDNVGEGVFAFGKNFTETGLSTTIMASRGCPFNCFYCASKPVWRGKVTYRSIESVLAEAKMLVDNFGIRQLRFTDDTLNLSRERLHSLCKGLGKLGVVWRCSVRAGLSTYDDFKLMHDSGCMEISPGIESGDQRVLTFLNKKATVKDNINLVTWAMKAGINTRILLMSGTPGEHIDSPERTKEFLDAIDYHIVSLTFFRPVPGSPIWINPEKFDCKILDRNINNYSFYSWRKNADGIPERTPIASVIETKLLSKEQLEDNMRRMFRYVQETGKANEG
jgi:anaerobic magnesium-protoporphyrin IX monomethyl ester cyclase